MNLKDIQGLKLKIQSEMLPLSVKYEYLKSLSDMLETYKYSFFAMEKSLKALQMSFNNEVFRFNQSLNQIFEYLKISGSLNNLEENEMMYNWLLDNIGVLMFRQDDVRAYSIINYLLKVKNKNFPVFNINDKYVDRLRQIVSHLNKYGDLPVQTDRVFKLDGGTYMGSFLAHNKRRIYMLKEGNEYAYHIARYYEKKYLTFEDKLNEVYDYLYEKGYLPYIDDTKIKFSNGEIMSYFISHNRKKLSLMDDMCSKYVIDYLDKRKGLNFEDKITELYGLLLDEKFILTKDSLFSDGIHIKTWLRENKRLLEKLKNDKRVLLIWEKCYKLSFEEKAYVKFKSRNSFKR